MNPQYLLCETSLTGTLIITSCLQSSETFKLYALLALKFRISRLICIGTYTRSWGERTAPKGFYVAVGWLQDNADVSMLGNQGMRLERAGK